METWKNIEGYIGKYDISNIGRIKSLKIDRILSPGTDNDGYLIACLSDKSVKFISIHRLVALAFIPNPENKPCVNHKNGVKKDNNISNLEWNTYSENNKHAYDIGLKTGSMKGKFGKDNHTSKPVSQYTKDMKFISTHGSAEEACRKTRVHRGNICAVCRGERKSAGGFIWTYNKPQ